MAEIDELRNHMNVELRKFAEFITLTNHTIEDMQESIVLITDKLTRLIDAMNDYNEQIHMQQKQIKDLAEIARTLSQIAHTGSLGTLAVRLGQSVQEQASGQQHTRTSPPASGGRVVYDPARDVHRIDGSDV